MVLHYRVWRDIAVEGMEHLQMHVDPYKHLAWFLGPKAENATHVEDLFDVILADYVHWRRNYFPSDPLVLPQSVQRMQVEQQDLLNANVHKLLAELRRNFPFYSPRYFGHQLSDTMIPAMLGYFAGMLFNPNNVTAEAAPVTVDMEVDACNELLRMLGFSPPPPLPPELVDPADYYRQQSKSEFGWAHITSGGTVANIEALWVARQVRYFPLAVRSVVIQRRKVPTKPQFTIEVKRPDGTPCLIEHLTEHETLLLRPNEAIYLLPKWVQAVREADANFEGAEAGNLGKRAWNILSESPYSLSNGVGAAFAKYPPYILVAGTGHYSIRKSANLIGIGSDHVIRIRTDPRFRMDVSDLKRCIEERVLRAKGVPVCVVANVGTTEEGAVDPVHEIVELREKLEKEENVSFWLHIDGAWGAYMRSVFRMEPDAAAKVAMTKISRSFALRPPSETPTDWPEWHSMFGDYVEQHFLKEDAKITTTKASASHPPPEGTDGSAEKDELESVSNVVSTEEVSGAKWLRKHLAYMLEQLRAGSHATYTDLLRKFPNQLKKEGFNPPSEATEAFTARFEDLYSQVNEFVSETVDFHISSRQRHGGLSYQRSAKLSWPAEDVCKAYFRFDRADSITVDPHKMGYIPYPCGSVCFRNDRIRHFILEDAPYITATKHSALVHVPPVYLDESNGKRSHRHAAFGPFILEGSKPGAAAAALWLAMRTVPLTQEHHGLLIRASLLAARELHEWLTRWNGIYKRLEVGLDFEFVSLSDRVPDTNIVTFIVKKTTSPSLKELNELTERVYSHFAIQTELGEMEYSYSQPFFISRTQMTNANYPVAELESLFERCGLGARARVEYGENGVTVLRAAVMNPYLLAMRSGVNHDLIRMFVEELARVASDECRSLNGSNSDSTKPIR